jgi:prepilin-type N-terminal cleavage/methylation domain-containing protein
MQRMTATDMARFAMSSPVGFSSLQHDPDLPPVRISIPPKQLADASAAFTLVELLVVVAIIAILASLLLPAFWKAKSDAWTAVCRSNLRQFGVSLECYLGDFHAYPLGPGGALVPYLGTKFLGDAAPPVAGSAPQGSPNTVYYCPAYVRLPAVHQDPSLGFQSYGYNVNGAAALGGQILGYSGLGLGGNISPPEPANSNHSAPAPIREAQVMHPGDMLAFGDSLLEWYAGVPGVNSPLLLGNSQLLLLPIHQGRSLRTGTGPVFLGDGVYQKRHNVRFNTLFCDEHIETLGISNLFSADSEVLNRWNNDNQPHQDLVTNWQNRW